MRRHNLNHQTGPAPCRPSKRLDMKTTAEIIELLEQEIANAEKQITDWSCDNVIRTYFYIVAWKTGLSVALNDVLEPVISSTDLPKLFTREKAEQLSETVRNGRQEKPQIYTPVEYYTLRRDSMKLTLEFLKK